MTRRRKTTVAVRKQPSQARSQKLVAAILEAAVRVLQREGAHRFTTIRVAEEAGVSVGSLYQYFPNKAALLFRLQSDEWHTTGAVLHTLLSSAGAPRERLHRTIAAFLESEQAEAELRRALDSAAAFYDDVPETLEHHRASLALVRAFIDEVLPAKADKAFATEVVKTTLSSVGKSITNRRRADLSRWADTITTMLWTFLESAGAASTRRAGRR